MNNDKRAVVYARQNSGPAKAPLVPSGLGNKTVAELRGIALDCEATVTTKMRKAQIIEAIKDKLRNALPEPDTSKLTPKQRRRMRKKANRQAA